MHKILFALHLFIGLGAMAGGLGAILNPTNPMGVPIELLKNSPFDDFLIPGIILFTVIGIGNVISAVIMLFKSRYQGYISSVFSWALVIWIIVQCIIINTISILHVVFFLIGVIEVFISTSILFEQNLFPANLIINYKKKIKKKL